MDERSPLEQLYEFLAYDGELNVPMRLYHSDVHFVRAAFQSKEWEVLPDPPEEVREALEQKSWREVDQLLYKEGLLPYYEYDIPAWYGRKWLIPQPLKLEWN